MARPPLPLGHHGNITASRSGGRWVARCRYRGYDGVTRKLERWGGSKTAALASLQDELSSAGTYENWLKNVVLPGLGELLLRECDVAHLDGFFRRLERAQKEVVADDGTLTQRPKYAANSRRTVRSVVSGILQQAVLHQAIPTNPIRGLQRIESVEGHEPAKPRGLTPDERRRLLDHVDKDPVAIAADLPDLIRFAIGTGLRIGEICAARWMDVNLSGLVVVNQDDMRMVPVVAVRQNVYPVKGKGLAATAARPRWRCGSCRSRTSSSTASAHAVSATSRRSSQCSPRLAAMAGRRTAGRRRYGAASERFDQRSTSTG